jgi:hypothetical protein
MTTNTIANDLREEFLFLNRLRESGTINMFGASTVLEDEFDLSRREARMVLTEWMQWVNQNPDNLNR